MSIPQRFLDEIRNRLTLSDVIGQKIRVVRAGREYKACCPFHNEKTPSFTINNDKQFFHCFGCGAHGDVIGFTMRYSNLSFMDAVESLASEAGLQMPKPDPALIEKSRKENDLYTLMQKASDWFAAQLEHSSNADVLGYLDQRGLGVEARTMFRIGYAPADGQAIRKYLQAEGFTDAQMLEVALIKNSAKGGQPYAFFRDRVMFPVSDKRGRVVAFGGRILPAHMRPPAQGGFEPPKYINSSDTPLFDKGLMLYGENFVRQNARQGHTVLVTEGYMDVIACHMAGFKGAVAPMGTALTESQILLLWSISKDSGKTPVLCFDGDNAGRRAASRGVERILPLLGPDKSVKLAFLSEGEDPDSLIKSKGSSGLRSVLDSAISLFEFIWISHTAGKRFETPEDRAGLEKTLQREIANIKDTDIQKHYRELIRQRIREAFFVPARFEKGRGNAKGARAPSFGMKLRAPARHGQKRALGEKILIATIVNNPEIYNYLEEEFGSFVFLDQKLCKLKQEIIQLLEKKTSEPRETLQNLLASQGFTEEMDDILNESVYVHAAFCRPCEVHDISLQEVVKQWCKLKNTLAEDVERQEIQYGWRISFDHANEEEEEKLRQILRLKALEEG